MKKAVIIAMTLLLIMLSSVAFANQDVIEVRLNDKYIDFTDEAGNKVDPELINDRTMVPMRKIFETLGADIEWDGTLKKVTARTNGKEIVLQIDNKEATLKDTETNEQKTIFLDSAPVILNDRTMVPVRFIAESLEKQVGWDATNRVVVIIDYDEIMQEINNDCSTFVEMLNEQKEEIKTFEQTISYSGTVIYKDTEETKNNEKLTLEGSINTKKSEDIIGLTFDFKISGKGKLYNALKEQGKNKVQIEMILDTINKELYTKSSLEKNDKWTKAETSIPTWLNEKLNIEELIRQDEVSLTKDSYDLIKQNVGMLKDLFGNDNIKSSGKSTKIYTIKFGLENILKALKIYDNEKLDDLLSLGKAVIEIETTYKNGMNSGGKIDLSIDWQMKDSKEKFTVEITGKSKINSYNKDVKITLPKENEIN